jgi:2-polyprenyl-3-methyl-5-hydroxy-6-metoxy-1,4-benzoquinol methylase
MSASDGRPGTGEPHYRSRIEQVRERGIERLGLATGWAWHDDPRHLLFTFARYKFVAKMLEGLDRVLEVGCADGFSTRLVAQNVKSVVAVDFDPEFIADAIERSSDRWPIEFRVHDILQAPVQGQFDAAYALDVLEHIPEDREDTFVANICGCLTNTGVLVIGTPSLGSQIFASPQSKEGHVNCKSAQDLQRCLSRQFANVFVFSMNDEVIHTGFSKMAHYLMALCCSPKARRP